MASAARLREALTAGGATHAKDRATADGVLTPTPDAADAAGGRPSPIDAAVASSSYLEEGEGASGGGRRERERVVGARTASFVLAAASRREREGGLPAAAAPASHACAP